MNYINKEYDWTEKLSSNRVINLKNIEGYLEGKDKGETRGAGDMKGILPKSKFRRMVDWRKVPVGCGRGKEEQRWIYEQGGEMGEKIRNC